MLTAHLARPPAVQVAAMEAAAAPAALSSWQPAAGGSVLGPGKPASPPQPGNEAASPSERGQAAAAAAHALFQGFPSAADAPGAGIAPQQLRNLQRLYGSLAQAHHHSSRTSLPDIAEEEPSPLQQLQQATAAAAAAASSGRLQPSGASAPKVTSEEDIFAMGGGLEIASASGGGEQPGAGAAGPPGAVQQQQLGAGSMVAGAPPLAYDLSLVGQMPAGGSQSRTLFVRNIDASVADEELQAVFEVGGGVGRTEGKGRARRPLSVLLCEGGRRDARDGRSRRAGKSRAGWERVTAAVLWPTPPSGATAWRRRKQRRCRAAALGLGGVSRGPAQPVAGPPCVPAPPTPRPPAPPLRALQAFGEIHSMYTACKHRGFVVISYYDIRAATLANHTLQGQALKGQALEVHFSLPKDEKESRQVRRGYLGCGAVRGWGVGRGVAGEVRLGVGSRV